MINYYLLNESINHYELCGFKRIESPWLVSEAISNITKPPEAENYYVTKSGTNKVFVASGEQSFLYLINKGFLPHGKYQTITPCLRNESFDETHSKYFMKNELIVLTNDGKKEQREELHSIIDSAKTFFGKYIDLMDIDVVKEGEDQFDLVYTPKNIELGSYGIRTCLFCTWVYGTGLAEPRFSRVLEGIRNE